MPVLQVLCVLPWAGVLVGCGSKGAVSLSARIDNATLAIQAVPLGRRLSGEFDLLLELGSAASESTTVSLGTVSVKGEGDTVVSVRSMADESFPITVRAGQTQTIHFVLDDRQLIEAAQGEALCSGGVWYSGTVTDTLSDGKPTVASSIRLTPVCE